MIRSTVFLTALLCATPAAAQDAEASRAAIEAAMADSAAGWNAGDLDRFLGIYAADPGTSFVTAEGVVRGLDPIRQRYRTSYAERFDGDPAGGQALSFTFEDFRMLGPDHALLIARYHLSAAGNTPAASGLTSVVFARTADGWRIISDHSS